MVAVVALPDNAPWNVVAYIVFHLFPDVPTDPILLLFGYKDNDALRVIPFLSDIV